MDFLRAGANPTGPSGACFAHARPATLAKDTDFTTRFPGIRVLDPKSRLREIEKQQKREEELLS